MNHNYNQPPFGAPLSRRSTLTRGLVYAVNFNGGTSYQDSARVAGPGTYIPALTNLAHGVNRFGKFVEFTTAGTSHHIDWNGVPWIPTGGGMTVSMLYEKVDATNRAAVCWSVDVVLAGSAYYCHGATPHSDGNAYLQFGNTNLAVGGLTYGADHWIFSTGPRGMELWQNGILVGSNASNPTRSTDVTHVFKIGAGLSALGFVADLCRYNSLCMWDRELNLREIWTLNTDPYAPWRDPV